MPIKTVKILDTNVFLDDPQALQKFVDTLIVVPLSVIEELDKFKKDITEKGRNARWVIKAMDKMRDSNKAGAIAGFTAKQSVDTYGVPLDKGSRLVVELNHISLLKDLDPSVIDNRILSVAKYYANIFIPQGIKVSLVTMDMNLRIKADANEISAENYEGNSESVTDEVYKGYLEVKISDEMAKEFRETKELILDQELKPNQYVIMSTERNPKLPILGRYDSQKQVVVPLIIPDSLWGIAPKNIEQQFAVDALLNPDIPLVTLSGAAGTGKTLLSVAVGLVMSLDRSEYNKLLIARPVFPMGKDIGFLPGDIKEKLDPWMQPIYDNLEFLMSEGKNSSSKSSGRWKELVEQGLIQVEALTYIRGRSIPKQFFIIDESQNLTKHEIKTILSRASEGTKIVLTGDPDQIDAAYLDKSSNGLSTVIEIFKDDDVAAHVQLTQGERSKLADRVVKLIS